MASLIISADVLAKLASKHNVSRREVEQCFDNRCGMYLVDDREDNQTDPATLWFIAETNYERVLKVVFVPQDGNHHLKTAYEPDAIEIDIFERIGK